MKRGKSSSAHAGGAIRGPDDFVRAFAVSRETADRLLIYAELLAKWQKAINLVAPSTLSDVWDRHMADSAQLFDLAPNARAWADLGSGAGFPGLVIAILLAGAAPGHGKVLLFESDSRKCAFLAEVVRKTGLAGAVTVEIRNERIETAATQANVTPVEVITARALAPLDRLFDLCRPLFGPQSLGLFLKGREFQSEIDAARQRWRFESRLIPSRTDSESRIVEIRDLSLSEGHSP